MGERSFEERVTVGAPAEVVWALVEDVERWPTWTPTMRRIELLDPAPLAVGSRARVRQPRLPVTVWTVDQLVPGERFSWTSSSPGLRSVADHQVRPTDGGCEVLLVFRLSGPAAGLAAGLMGGLVRRYVRTEAEGLKRRAEQTAT